MKKQVLVAALALTILGFGAAVAAVTDEVVRRIGCTPAETQDSIFNNFRSGNYYPPYCNRAYQAVPADQRAEVVRLLGDYAKDYLASGAFRTRYLKEWERSKPVQPEQEKVTSPADQNAQFDQDIRKLEEQINNPATPQEQKQYLRQAVEGLKQTKEQMNTPEMNQMFQQGYEMQRQEASQRYEQEMQKYRERLAEWEKEKDINYVLKRRLRDFLDLTADMDFHAQLTKRGNKYVFADPALEAKDRSWKMCFRSGREAVTAARAYASAWLRELGE